MSRALASADWRWRDLTGTPASSLAASCYLGPWSVPYRRLGGFINGGPRFALLWYLVTNDDHPPPPMNICWGGFESWKGDRNCEWAPTIGNRIKLWVPHPGHLVLPLLCSCSARECCQSLPWSVKSQWMKSANLCWWIVWFFNVCSCSLLTFAHESISWHFDSFIFSKCLENDNT